MKAQVPDVSMRPPLCTDADDLLRCSATVGNLGLTVAQNVMTIFRNVIVSRNVVIVAQNVLIVAQICVMGY